MAVTIISTNISQEEFCELVARKNEIYSFAKRFESETRAILQEARVHNRLGWHYWRLGRRGEKVSRVSQKRLLAELVRLGMQIFSTIYWSPHLSELHVADQQTGLLLDLGAVEVRVTELAQTLVTDHESLSQIPNQYDVRGFLISGFMSAAQQYFKNHPELHLRPRKDSDNKKKAINSAIQRAATSAPSFEVARGRLRYRQEPAEASISTRKAAVRDRCKVLQELCSRRQNEQPELKKLVDRYASGLRALRSDRGAYRLHLAGLDIETFVRANIQSNPDHERNPMLDADLQFATQSLIIAHAGLVALFPELSRLATELDVYLQQTQAIDALRERVLDPVLDHLAASRGILDAEAQQITGEIKRLDEEERRTMQVPSLGVTSVKHGWLRGALAAMGRFLLNQSQETAKIVRDEAVKNLARHPGILTGAILGFLVLAKSFLIKIAEVFPTAFGWLRSLFAFLGI